MNHGIASQFNVLEQSRHVAFLGAGGLLLGHAIVQGIHAFTTLPAPVDLFAPVGHLLALVGLVGLYPVVNDATPTVARIGAVGAIVIALGWAVVTLSILAMALRSPPPQIEMFFRGLSILVLVSTVLPYVLFGVIVLRSSIMSRRVGVLLLAPAALLTALLGNIAVLRVSPLDGVVIGIGLALSMLAIGYSLRSTRSRTDRTSLNSDVTHG